MNSSLALSRWLASAVASVVLTISTGSALAQNTNPTNTFDTAASITSFAHWWGITPVITWDETLDAGNDPFSGSARLEVGFTEEGDEQFMTHFTIANRWQWDNGYVLDATTYTNLAFDLKVDPSSAVTVSGANYGNLQVGLTTSTSWDNRINPPSYPIPLSATNWTRVDIPIDPAWPYLNEVVGFYVYMWSGDSHTNTLTLNLDNVMLTRPSEPVVIPPPTVALLPAVPGLNLVASTDVQYQRQNIRTVDTNLGWVNSTEPVTYELTILDSPGADAPNFQAHLFLVPAVPNDDAPSIDWNTPNLVWFHLENLADGGGQVTFRYKTNLPGGNNMLFNTDPLATHPSGELMGVGSLGTLSSTDILGTWKLTFLSDTDATLTAPDDATLDVSIPAAAAALFTREMRLYCGIQANNATQYGKGYVFDRVSVSRPGGILVEDDFESSVLDPAKWEVRAGGAANAVFVVPPSGAWWGQWTLPAVGFSPQLSGSLAPGTAWTGPLSQTQIQILSTRRVLLSAAELEPEAGYFRMLMRDYTKLQVLLPGETAAPGTPTGKTGSPDPQQVLGTFEILVNAVDDEWYPVSGINHTVHLTTTDEFAVVPEDAPLVNSTRTFVASEFFGQAGTFTITASDVTDDTKTPGTSSPVTVGP